MTMDVEPAGGRMVLHVGPVERALMIAVGAGIVGLGGWSWDKLNDVSASVANMTMQQAVTNSRLDTLTTQLADIPGLSRQVAEMRIRIERNAQDIRDLADEDKENKKR